MMSAHKRYSAKDFFTVKIELTHELWLSAKIPRLAICCKAKPELPYLFEYEQQQSVLFRGNE